MADERFYNKMGFEVKFRQYWKQGNPPIILKAGEIIEGPYDILSTMMYLKHIPIDFSQVDSITMPNNRPDIITMDQYTYPNVPITPHPIKITSTEPNITVEEPQETDKSDESFKFDPNEVNWLRIKVAELEQICKENNIDITHLKDLSPKERKWKLVGLVKTHYKI